MKLVNWLIDHIRTCLHKNTVQGCKCPCYKTNMSPYHSGRSSLMHSFQYCCWHEHVKSITREGCRRRCAWQHKFQFQSEIRQQWLFYFFSFIKSDMTLCSHTAGILSSKQINNGIPVKKCSIHNKYCSTACCRITDVNMFIFIILKSLDWVIISNYRYALTLNIFLLLFRWICLMTVAQ